MLMGICRYKIRLESIVYNINRMSITIQQTMIFFSHQKLINLLKLSNVKAFYHVIVAFYFILDFLFCFRNQSKFHSH